MWEDPRVPSPPAQPTWRSATRQELTVDVCNVEPSQHEHGKDGESHMMKGSVSGAPTHVAGCGLGPALVTWPGWAGPAPQGPKVRLHNQGVTSDQPPRVFTATSRRRNSICQGQLMGVQPCTSLQIGFRNLGSLVRLDEVCLCCGRARHHRSQVSSSSGHQAATG